MPRTKKTTTPEEVKETKAPKKAKSALEIGVYDLKGNETKTIELPKEVFAVEPNMNLLRQYVHVYLTNQRQGTASAKGRSEVNGSTRKIYRQKGTGKARHGSIKAPIFVGGGVVGGPKPKDYDLKLSKKQTVKAMVYALSIKAKDKAIMAVDKEVVEMKPKTKTMAALLKTLEIADKKVMMIVPQLRNTGLAMSARNIPTVQLVSTSNVNPYNLLHNEKIIFTEDALEILKSRYSQKS